MNKATGSFCLSSPSPRCLSPTLLSPFFPHCLSLQPLLVTLSISVSASLSTQPSSPSLSLSLILWDSHSLNINGWICCAPSSAIICLCLKVRVFVAGGGAYWASQRVRGWGGEARTGFFPLLALFPEVQGPPSGMPKTESDTEGSSRGGPWRFWFSGYWGMQTRPGCPCQT